MVGIPDERWGERPLLVATAKQVVGGWRLIVNGFRCRSRAGVLITPCTASTSPPTSLKSAEPDARDMTGYS